MCVAESMQSLARTDSIVHKMHDAAIAECANLPRSYEGLLRRPLCSYSGLRRRLQQQQMVIHNTLYLLKFTLTTIKTKTNTSS